MMLKPNWGKMLGLVRQHRPVIHHIMNQVTMSFVANGVLALGGRPMMARHPLEVAEAVEKADALVLNLGTPAPETINAMLIAGHIARKKGIPIVFDPVGVGLSTFRMEAARLLLTELSPDAICGNAAELAFLLQPIWHGKGIDAVHTGLESVEIAAHVSKHYGTLSVLTGQTDVICHDGIIAISEHGDEWLTRVTGTGCLATSLVALFLAAARKDQQHGHNHQLDWEATVAAICTLGIAAEEARQTAKGPGSFQSGLLDALYTLDADSLTDRAVVRIAVTEERSLG